MVSQLIVRLRLLGELSQEAGPRRLPLMALRSVGLNVKFSLTKL